MRASLTALACLLALAGCGNTHHAAVIVTTTVAASPVPGGAPTLAGHPCSGRAFTMGCALADLTPPVAPAPWVGPRAAAEPSIFGIDFAWGAPSIAAMRLLGARFGASYLSYDASKNWTPGRVAAYHAAGIATVAVWESTATRATQGYSAGYSDAKAAAAQLAALGAPANQSFTLAIDCDCSGPQVAAYFKGAQTAEPGRTNAYGGYYPLAYLCAQHLVGTANWQTYAWSRGLWLPASCAPLEQYLNGATFDRDRAISAFYGQWPYTPPGPPVDPYAIYPVTRFRLAGGVRASERRTVTTWDRAKCRVPARRAVCRSSRAHLILLRDRLYHVATHPRHNGHATWGLYGRGRRYRGISRRLA